MDAQDPSDIYIVKALMGQINDAESKAVLGSLMGSDNDANGELLLGARMQGVDPPDAPVKAVVCPALVWAKIGPEHQFPLLLRLIAPGKIPDGSRERLLHATARLGLPLYYHVLPDWPIHAAYPVDILEIDQAKEKGILTECSENSILHHLSTKFSRGSPKTQHFSVPGKPAPNILLTRADGKDLSERQVKCLWILVHVALNDSERAEAFNSMLTPEAFIQHWNVLYHSSGEKCPVTLACKSCGKDNGKLLKCGKCSVVRYCDSECQKSDWAAHKKVCVKG